MVGSLWKTGLSGTTCRNDMRLARCRELPQGSAPGGGAYRLMKVGVIMNPVAGGGRLKRRWPDIDAALGHAFGEFELRETQAGGDAVTLAMDLAANGCELLIAAGGDGTVSEVADGLIKAAAEGNKAALGLLPCGTGTDFARGLGVP